MVLTNDNEESRRVVESCYKRHKTTLNPIIDWTDRDVWDFIHAHGIPYCSLYDEGFTRIGCIGCPMAQREGRSREFRRWPKYKELYLRAFARMREERQRRGYPAWTCGTDKDASPRDIYHWWMEDGGLPGQMEIEDIIEEDNDDQI